MGAKEKWWYEAELGTMKAKGKGQDRKESETECKETQRSDTYEIRTHGLTTDARTHIGSEGWDRGNVRKRKEKGERPYARGGIGDGDREGEREGERSRGAPLVFSSLSLSLSACLSPLLSLCLSVSRTVRLVLSLPVRR